MLIAFRLARPQSALAHAAIGGPAESLDLTYEPGAHEDFAAQLQNLRPDETRRRITLAGPHRDDLALSLDSRPAGRYASEGQQRTIALALKLAQAATLRDQRSVHPILLLDDIFGELDPLRRHALLRALPEKSQQLITTTHLGWMEQSFRPDRIYHVEPGALHEAKSTAPLIARLDDDGDCVPSNGAVTEGKEGI